MKQENERPVRIDERTTIFVPEGISDAEARKRFLSRQEKAKRNHELSPYEKRLRKIAEEAKSNLIE
jgi:hypothetical protein